MSEVKKYLELYNLTVEELIEKAHKITIKKFNKKVEFCSIVSAKTGACPENCKYCSQSVHYETNVEHQDMLSKEEVLKAAVSAKENGATRFAIVTSGTKLNGKDFELALEMIKEIAKLGLKPCACTGMLNEEEMKRLKEAGCTRYNHNINTNEDFYKEVCTTHTYKERIETVKLAKKAGMETCVGVILGMGESREDRIKMALELKEIGTNSIPINILDPIKGTPMENFKDKIDEDEFLKTVCIFRIIMPDVYLRFAGGRASRLSRVNQKLGLFGAINALIVGNYLTTTGVSVEDDYKMLETLGFSKE